MQLVMENENHEPNYLFRILFLIGLCLFFVACASKVKQVSYDPSADAIAELAKLEQEMAQAESEQIAVFAPDSYSAALKNLDDAKRLQQRDASNEKILKELSEARSYFENAKEVANRSLKAVPEIADARENALVAGAVRNNLPRLKEADRELRSITDDFERKNPDIAINKRTDLQKRYLDIELSSIKSNRLAEAQSLIETAKRRGAARYAPKTLKSAEAKMRSADLRITTDRHNDSLLTAIQNDVTAEARRLEKVNEMVRRSGNPGGEDIALQVVMRDEQINALNQQVAMSEAQKRELAAQQARLTEQQSQQEAQRQAQLKQQEAQAQTQVTAAQKEAEEAKRKLEAQKRIEEVYRNAQQAFTADEAQVYRQGDNLIIRMKQINFPSGRAEVPAAAYESLGKVNQVIRDLNAQRVIVEGHTDSSGGPTVNQKISEQRAAAVASFLRQQDETRMSGGTAGQSGSANQQETQSPELKIEALGYGYQYPITTNKTKQGRAQNRRVDIVIVPGLVAQ